MPTLPRDETAPDTNPPDPSATFPAWTKRDLVRFEGFSLEPLPELKAMLLAIYTSQGAGPGRPRKSKVLPVVVPITQARHMATRLLEVASFMEAAPPEDGKLQ